MLTNVCLSKIANMKKKQKLAAIMFTIAIVIMPLLASLSVKSSNAWQIAANHCYASADGAAIMTTAVGAGWALGLLCGVQLVAGILIAG